MHIIARHKDKLKALVRPFIVFVTPNLQYVTVALLINAKKFFIAFFVVIHETFRVWGSFRESLKFLYTTLMIVNECLRINSIFSIV